MFKKVNVMTVYTWGNRKIRQLFPWLRNKIQWILISILAMEEIKAIYTGRRERIWLLNGRVKQKEKKKRIQDIESGCKSSRMECLSLGVCNRFKLCELCDGQLIGSR